MKKKSVAIEFTAAQTERLTDLFRQLGRENAARGPGRYGMVLAQVFPDGMVVRVIDDVMAHAVIRACTPAGVEPDVVSSSGSLAERLAE